MIKELLKKNAAARELIDILGLKRRKIYVHKYGLREVGIITSAFQQVGICAFADFGTLLGLIREGKLLAGDADIDIGVVEKNGKEIKRADSILEAMGYRLCREFTVKGQIKEQSYMKNHVRVDLQVYCEEDPDTMNCYLFYNPRKDPKEKYWKSVIKKCPIVNATKTINIEHHQIRVPVNAEEILTYKYGENWRVPDRSWDYWKGPNTYPSKGLGFVRSIYNGGIQE